jgi:hypothetical protein
MSLHRTVAPVVALLLGLCACGAAPPRVRPTSEFTEAKARVFEDGVDFVADPEVLEGRWLDEWERDLERRVSDADFVAIVTVETIRIDTDLDRRNTLRLLTDVQDRFFGESPGDELALVVREGAIGWGTVEGNDQRLLDNPYVAFVKWYATEDGTVLPHWHLSPSTDAVVRRVRALAERRSDAPRGREIVVTHEN